MVGWLDSLKDKKSANVGENVQAYILFRHYIQRAHQVLLEYPISGTHNEPVRG